MCFFAATAATASGTMRLKAMGVVVQLAASFQVFF
jgi:hypothetical protein